MSYFIADKVAIQSLLRDEDEIVYRYIESLAKKVKRLAVIQVGVDTGKLRSSISYEMSNATRVKALIYASDNKALMHHEGTKPHMIEATNKKALKFNNGETIVFSKRVHHPGTKPNRFLTDSLVAVI